MTRSEQTKKAQSRIKYGINKALEAHNVIEKAKKREMTFAEWSKITDALEAARNAMRDASEMADRLYA